jgi:hypothetical protein
MDHRWVSTARFSTDRHLCASAIDTITAGKGEQMTSAPKPDPGRYLDADQTTVYRLDHLMLVLVGSLLLFPVSTATWSLITAINPDFGIRDVWTLIIATMGVPVIQLIVGIVGIVLLFKGNVRNDKGGNLR